MEKKKFIKPEMEVVEVETTNILQTSPVGGDIGFGAPCTEDYPEIGEDGYPEE